MRKIIIILSVAMLSSALSAQSIEEQKVYWNQGPLTLDMFQTRHTRETDKPVTFLEWEIHKTDTVVTSGNTSFISHKLELYMYKSLSWYDPDKYPEWSLRYNQTEFDLIEVLRRQYQNALNSDTVSYLTDSYYNKLLRNRTDTYDTETDCGTDTAAIARYEELLREQLATVKELPPCSTLPSLKPQPQFGISLMYDFEYFREPVSTAYKPLHGVQVMGYLYMGRFWSDISYTWSWCGGLKTDDFYYDKKLDYYWQKGESARSDKFVIRVGYDVIDSKYIAIAPAIGVGTTCLIQNTGVEDDKGVTTNSKIGGFNRLTAGLSFGYKYLRIYDQWKFLSERMVRLNVMAANTRFHDLGSTWSLNVGLSIESKAWRRSGSK